MSSSYQSTWLKSANISSNRGAVYMKVINIYYGIVMLTYKRSQ